MCYNESCQRVNFYFDMDLKNEYGTLDVQKGLLILLKEFHSFCTLNKIEYSLAWGSLLGAVRHKGFIPWDDDLDVMMDRKNYNRFVQRICKSSKLICHFNENGLWIDKIRLKFVNSKNKFLPTLDIFIVDNAPDGNIQKKILMLKIMILQGMLKKNMNISKGSFVMRLCSLLTYLLGKVVSDKTKLSLYSKWSQKYNGCKTNKLAIYNSEFAYLHYLYDSDMMNSYSFVPFEDIEISIINKFDSCLRIMYGNYMIPPLNKSPKHMY